MPWLHLQATQAEGLCLGLPVMQPGHQTPSKKFKEDSCYTGSDNEDDFNDFSMNKGFIQYDL